jgi:crotonobetainyl-CoA:carnitine CoA-transferase CaiB-like acyl-CoA transferase
VELDRLINQWTSGLSVDALEERLNSESVPGIRIFDMADIFQDPHYKERATISKVGDKELGAVAMASPVPRLSRTPGEIRHTGKRIGEDTFSVLAQVGGFSKEELRLLQKNHIIFAHENLT